jgi:spore coat polysaccharide biosynthesis protein SpsF (cytidylyltransferase family)
MTEEIINLRSLIQSGQTLAKIDRLEQERNELKQENELFRQAHKAEQDRRRKYENALEEIREIEQCMAVAKGVSENPVSAIDHVSNLLSEYENRRIKILTKINEVLEC